MAVIEEKIDERFVRHYSDEGFYLLQVETGIEYSDAIDVVPCRYSYEETDKVIEDDDAQLD